jgi:hypothetical protein
MCGCSHGLIGRAGVESPRAPESISEKPRNFKVLEFKKVAQGDVVGMLKEMLAMARSGHLRAAAVAVHADIGDTGGCFALGDGDIAHLVCCLAWRNIKPEPFCKPTPRLQPLVPVPKLRRSCEQLDDSSGGAAALFKLGHANGKLLL